MFYIKTYRHLLLQLTVISSYYWDQLSSGTYELTVKKHMENLNIWIKHVLTISQHLWLTDYTQLWICDSIEITNKMQPCNRIYYSTVHWRLHMFSAAYRSSSGVLTAFAASGLHMHVVTGRSQVWVGTHTTMHGSMNINPLNPKLNPICYLLALLGAHHFLHVSRIRVKLLIFRLLMSYVYGAPILDVSRSHTTTQHSR